MGVTQTVLQLAVRPKRFQWLNAETARLPELTTAANAAQLSSKSLIFFVGAPEGNRTLVYSLGNSDHASILVPILSIHRLSTGTAKPHNQVPIIGGQTAVCQTRIGLQK